MRAIAKGDVKQEVNEPTVWFTSVEAMARVFSRINMLLIEILRDKDLESVTELAKEAGKLKTNVVRALKLLEDFEIVEYEEGAGGRKAPRLKYIDFRASIYPRRKAVH
jgi:predicted transcriptional regulator